MQLRHVLKAFHFDSRSSVFTIQKQSDSSVSRRKFRADAALIPDSFAEPGIKMEMADSFTQPEIGSHRLVIEGPDSFLFSIDGDKLRLHLLTAFLFILPQKLPDFLDIEIFDLQGTLNVEWRASKALRPPPQQGPVSEQGHAVNHISFSVQVHVAKQGHKPINLFRRETVEFVYECNLLMLFSPRVCKMRCLFHIRHPWLF